MKKKNRYIEDLQYLELEFLKIISTREFGIFNPKAVLQVHDTWLYEYQVQ